ncbi:MAG: MMPL family transporter, partial [Flammeovirgaceae bacterium]|nr:MMPL family transporter [Flammeovirgaceae bacterium]MDW8287818.1 MMPL family transporter [Flammeovirgaceae bacterium]
MWTRLALFILKYRWLVILLLLAFTGLMVYQAKKVQMSYEFTKIVPDHDEDMQFYQHFRRVFGEDANALAIGLKDSSLYELSKFEAYRQLGEEIKKVEGAREVISLANLQYLAKDTLEKRFILVPLFKNSPSSQVELDSLLAFASQLKFFENKLLNPLNGATLMIVSLDQKLIQSEKRVEIIENIREKAAAFTQKTNIAVHFTGLPYIRTAISTMVKKELNQFLVLSLIVSATVMFLFFRSPLPILYALFMIGMVIVWTLGTLGWLGYKITLLSGLLPPILTTIGIPNCIYMINKYQQEYLNTGNKEKAIIGMVQKIGIVTFLTNTTTAIGFVVLLLTDVDIMKEFGTVAALNIMGLYLISIFFLPAALSYLPAPSERSVRHLSSRGVRWFLAQLDFLVTRHRFMIYGIVIVVLGISYYGMTLIKANSFMLDDVPENNHVKKDLLFFEEHFKGVVPLEIIVDTGKEKGV